MKRLLVLLMVLVLSLSLAVQASAAPKHKPPKKLCFLIDGTIAYFILSIKPFGGKFNLASGQKAKFYAIHGEHTNLAGLNAPVAGSGHMLGDVFHFALTGRMINNGEPYLYVIDGQWDTASQTGTIDYVSYRDPTPLDTLEYFEDSLGETMVPVDCGNLNLPKYAGGEGAGVSVRP